MATPGMGESAANSETQNSSYVNFARNVFKIYWYFTGVCYIITSMKQPGMCDSTCCFEPTFTLNGILILSDGCQASVCSGRQKSDCGYPPSFARSQNIRPGILGDT